MEFKPYPYQQRAIAWVKARPRCLLFLDMGLGKSVIALTALSALMDYGEVGKVLVVAPKKVAETTWADECEKWSHLRGLRVSKIIGTEKKREKALAADADIYVIGRDNFVWLAKRLKGKVPFSSLVLDELTSFKSPNSQRSKAVRKLTPFFDRVIGLTGTPAPNGYEDLWAQVYCVDSGARLGRTSSWYLTTYFTAYTTPTHTVYTLRKGAGEAIRAKLSDIALTMQAKDYLQMPSMIVHDIRIDLPAEIMKQYRELEREMVVDLTEKEQQGGTIMATSAAALMNKLSQFANGSVYNAEHEAQEVHAEKAERLAELVEQAKSPVLVFYQYKHDIPRILEKLKGYKTEIYKDADSLRRWNARKTDVLLAHPASTAYGLNMQQGGHYIVWFGTGWDLELYQQANARLHRQGQTHPVTVYRLIAKGTVDERAAAALDNKKSVQQALMDGLKGLMDKYKCS